MKKNKLLLTGLALAAFTVRAQTEATRPVPTEENVVNLEKFTVDDIPLDEVMLPTGRPINSVFGTQMSVLDTPRSVSLLSTMQMKDLDIRGPLDFVRAVPGASTTSQFGAANVVDLRGQAAEVYQNGIQRTTRSDGMPLSFNGVESMDVVKGPASVVYGPSSLVGGYVNLITKRPNFDGLAGYVSTTYGTWDTLRWQVDVGAPIIKDKLAYRFSYEGEDSDSFYRNVYNRQNDLYFALSYIPSDHVRIDFNTDLHIAEYVSTTGMNRPTQELIDDGLYYAGEASSGGSRYRGAFAVIPVSGVVKLDRSITLVAPGDHDEGTNYQAQLDTYFYFTPDSWLVNRNYFEYYTLQQRQYAQRYYNNVDYSYNFQDRLEYHLNFTTGAIQHEIVTGLALRYMNARGYGDFYNEYLNSTDLTGDPLGFPITNLTGVVAVPGYSGDYAIPGGVYGNPSYPYTMASTIDSESVQTGVFFQHTLKFNERLSLLYGGRFDVVSIDVSDPLPPPGYTAAQDSTTQGMGAGDTSLTYKPADWSTFYGTFSYNQSTSGAAGGTPVALTRNALLPNNFHIENFLYEVGGKFDLYHSKLFLSTAVFYQQRSQTDALGNVSEVDVGGAEVEVHYQPNRNFYASAGFSYLDAIVPGQKSGSLTANVYDAFAAPYGTGRGSPNYGSLPVSDRQIPGIPRHSGNLSARYKWNSGFGISGNVVVTDEMNTSYLGNVTIPVQYTVNAAVFFEAKRWDARVSFLNLTDEENWTPIGSIFGNELIQADLPFHVEATVRYKF